MSFLFKLCLSCQRNKVIPIYWKIAHEVYIPKNKPPNPSSIKDFRSISLMNVEGKLFFSLVSQRFVSHIIQNNKFVNSFIQKGYMGKIPGCWEHMSMVWDSLKSVKRYKTSFLPFGLMSQMHMVLCLIDSFILLSSVMVCLKSGHIRIYTK